MPFHRFEDLETVRLTPHLSSAESPIIEGKYLYYCLNQKKAGTGSELHYHPNELVIFTLEGKVNAVVGKDRRIISPGTLIMIPPNVRHSMKATEDGPSAYLYIKDQTWTVVGLAADEEVPDAPMSVEEVNEKFDTGTLDDRKGTSIKSDEDSAASTMIIEGVPNCYFELLSSLDAPYSTATQISWFEGARAAFGFYELPKGYQETSEAADHECFYYVIDGKVGVRVGNDRKQASRGDIIEVPLGINYAIDVSDSIPTRLLAVRSNEFLESKIKAD
ncbi:MAG: cupin domain-containing protein [Hyphomicrobiaceae bacterium]